MHVTILNVKQGENMNIFCRIFAYLPSKEKVTPRSGVISACVHILNISGEYANIYLSID
jgi:hypothetical protein